MDDEDVVTHDEQITSSGDGAFVAVFEDDPRACYLTDLYGRFVDGNRAFEDLTGYDRQDLRGRTCAESTLIPLDQLPTYAHALVRNAEGDPSGPDPILLRRKDGLAVPVEVRSVPIRICGDLLVFGVASLADEPRGGGE